MGELREKPAGTVRIAANDHAADSLLWPVLEKLLPLYPDSKVLVYGEPCEAVGEGVDECGAGGEGGACGSGAAP